MSLFGSKKENIDLGIIFRDLAVVVLGILIAVQVDGWVKERADRMEEQDILLGLKEEFKDNREQLEHVSESWNSARLAGEQLLLLTGNEISENDIPQIRKLTSDLYYRSYDPRSGLLRSVISAGKLRLISNTDLRARLADWPDLVGDMQDDLVWQDTFHYPQQFATLWQAVPLVEGSSLRSSVHDLFQDVGFENYLFGLVADWDRVMGEKDEIVAATNEIIGMIDAELE